MRTLVVLLSGMLLLMLFTLGFVGCRNPQSVDESTINEERMQNEPDYQLKPGGETTTQERQDDAREAQDKTSGKRFLEEPGNAENPSDEAITNSDVE